MFKYLTIYNVCSKHADLMENILLSAYLSNPYAIKGLSQNRK
jgi:hypothetical protein